MTYLREKRSGNYVICTRQEATIKLKTKKQVFAFFAALEGLWWGSKKPQVIKATYSRSQSYFWNAAEFWQHIK